MSERTATDYMIVCERMYHRIDKFEVDASVNSDHMPVCATIEDKERREKEEEVTNVDGVKSTEGRWRIRWDKEAIRRYKEKTNKNIFVETQQEETIEEKWTNLKKMVHEAMVKKRVNTTRREMGHKDWWDKECTRKKRLYEKWRVRKLDRGRYLEKRRNLKTLLEQKRKEKRVMEEEELKNIKNGAEVWKFINKKRRKKVRKINNIGGNEWMIISRSYWNIRIRRRYN